MKIDPSPRIDYCSDCDKEHGYECPKNSQPTQREEWSERFDERFVTPLYITMRGTSTENKTEIVESIKSFIRTEIERARQEGEIAGRNEERDHLQFLYRWISRLNGDKEHDKPESNWKQYVACMVHYPLSPWETGDWFEEPLEAAKSKV